VRVAEDADNIWPPYSRFGGEQVQVRVSRQVLTEFSLPNIILTGDPAVQPANRHATPCTP
jgi:hypothetical protein